MVLTVEHLTHPTTQTNEFVRKLERKFVRKFACNLVSFQKTSSIWQKRFHIKLFRHLVSFWSGIIKDNLQNYLYRSSANQHLLFLTCQVLN